jgi:DNA-binding PadR family transcriptional regulator
LALLGLAVETRENEGRRRRVFTITPRGLAALGAWLDRPSAAPTELRDPGLLQLFFADLASREARLRLAEERLEIHRAKLRAYSEDDRLQAWLTRSSAGQRTVEHWRGETLQMGLLYEAAAVTFWEGVQERAKPS